LERAFLRRETLRGLPVMRLEELPDRYTAASHHVHVAVVYPS
jgi:hypothetical protein